jgi:putative ubiquitin-RnfH superfamily antitoxin RatB of RatAB toxin-antitoxin module
MIRVTLVYSLGPRRVTETTLTLPDGSKVAHALAVADPRWKEESGLPTGSAPWSLGIWGRRSAPETVLREGDRIELYRPLRVDPKVARRERFVGQGARNAGLFARRRPHSKAGY